MSFWCAASSGDFTQDTLEAGGASLWSKLDPRPNSYIDS
jgi:hypothetical protein